MSQVRHILEDYHLEKVLNSTSRTTVFRAVDPATDRRVVIKLVHPAGQVVEETNRSAFLYAAEVARTGAIRGLPRIIDFGLTPDDNAFLVTDMVDLAVSVEELQNRSPQRLLAIARSVTEAVDRVAMSGAAHLNLRPANVLVTVDNSVLLSGYGTAAYLAGAPAGVWPDEGDRWVAPELAFPDALRTADLARADLYSLALLVCDLLGATVDRIGEDGVSVQLDASRVPNPAELAEVLTAALGPEPSTRTTTISDLRRLLGDGDGAGEIDAAVDALFDPDGFDSTGFETREITSPLTFEPPPTKVVVATPEGQVEPQLPPETPPQTDEPETPRSNPPEAVAPEASTLDPESPPVADRPEGPLRGFRWDIIAPAAAALLLVVVIGAVLMGRSGSQRQAQAAATPVPTVRPTPVPPVQQDLGPAINPLLEQADQLFLNGDVEGTRRLLAELPDGLVAGFSAGERELYEGLLGTIDGEDRDKALRDLNGGLEHGSVPMLRRAVAGLADLSPEELADDPDLQAKLQHARRAVRAYGRLRETDKTGEPLAVMDRASEMIGILPGYSRAYILRDHAAATLESQAEAAIRREDYAAAIEVLRALESRWPGRAGVADRIAWCETEMRTDPELESALAAARAAGDRNDPESGLRTLADANSSEGYRIRFESLRVELEAQLADLDAQGPTISVDPAFDPGFKKNETVVLPLTVTDDYRVERVTAWLWVDRDSDYRSITVEPAGDGIFRLEITPEIHGNKKVLYYIVASDRAGHKAFLGSPDAPFEIERKKWFKKMLPN